MRLALPVLTSMAAATPPMIPRQAIPRREPLPMPPMLYGTAWKKDRTAGLVTEAIRRGFRGVDTACQPKHYSEQLVGEGITAALDAGLVRSREELFLQTKYTPLRGQDPKNVPYDPYSPLEQQVEDSFQRSLENLGTDYVDSLLLHSPLPTLQDTLVAWRAFEAIHKAGNARCLGISNCYDLSFLEGLYNAAEVKPSVLQNRFYPDSGHDVDLRNFCSGKGITYQSFWTLTGNRDALQSKELRRIAAAKKVSPECVLYRALIQRGITPLSGTCDPSHMLEDVATMRGDFELSEGEVDAVFQVVLAGRR